MLKLVKKKLVKKKAYHDDATDAYSLNFLLATDH